MNERLDFPAIAAAALSRAESLVTEWLPEGKRQGHEWTAINPTRADSKPGSFLVNLATGKWADFASDDRGGDLVSLLAFLEGTSQASAARKLREIVLPGPISQGTKGTEGTSLKNKVVSGSPSGSLSQGTREPPRELPPIPRHAQDKRPAAHRTHGKPTATWVYRNAKGEPIAHVCRFDPPEGRKQYCPQTWDPEAKVWRWQAPPAPRPLYGLDRLAARPDAMVIVCEGEKASDACQALFPEAAVISSMNGAQSPAKSDWTPLAGRKVRIWPDADEPGAKYAATVAKLVKQAGVPEVEILDLASLARDPATGTMRELAKGWDAADALADGWTPAGIAAAAVWYQANGQTPKAARREVEDGNQWAWEHEPAFSATDDCTAEEIEKVWTNYDEYPFDPFVARAESSRDPFAILSQTFAKGALLEWEDRKPRRVIESKAADIAARALSGWLAWDAEGCSWYLWAGTHWAPQMTAGKAESLIAHLVHIGCGELGYRPTYLNGIGLLLQRRNLLRLPDFPRGLIPFANGVYDIVARRLAPATPTRALDWCLPHRYDPDADCPTIRAWLLRNVEDDSETVELLRAWLAALLRGMNLQKFLMLIGRGGTGKGTFQRLCLALVGQGNTAISALRDLEENRFETAKLYGKRLLMINEAGRHGGSINMLKAITGGDHVPLERKHVQQSGSFVFNGLVLMATNEDLQTTDSTSGLERRRLTVRFNVTATQEERAAWEARGGEAAVLHAEIPGLINWCLQLSGADIRAKIESPPERVRQDNILGMAAGNSVADWLIECTIPEPEAWAQIGQKEEYRSGDGKVCFEHSHDWLYANYLTYCLREGRRNPVANRKFSTTVIDIGETLGHQFVKATHPRDRYRAIKGLRLREDGDPLRGYREDDESIAAYKRKERKDSAPNFAPENSPPVDNSDFYWEEPF